MNNYTSSSDDEDWTVVADCSSHTTGLFDLVDHASAGGVDESGGGDTDETVLELREENRKLTEEWHRLRIENEGMAREIKGARFLMSKMLESLDLEHDDAAYEEVLGSDVREDLRCFQSLTKKLLCAVANGVVQKVEPVEYVPQPACDQESVNVPMPTPGGGEQVTVSDVRVEPATIIRPVEITTQTTRLPRIPEREVSELNHVPSLKVTRRMARERYRKQRPSWKPGGLRHLPGVSRKSRWASNRGAPRQAYAARRKC